MNDSPVYGLLMNCCPVNSSPVNGSHVNGSHMNGSPVNICHENDPANWAECVIALQDLFRLLKNIV